MTVRITRPVLAGVVAGAVLLAGAVACTAGGGDGAASTSTSTSASSSEPAQGAVPDAARAAAPAAPAQAPDRPISTERSLVRTAQLSLDVDDPVVATRKVRAAVAGIGGTVTQEQSGDDTSRLTLRVPAAALDRLIEDVAAFGHATARSAQVVDATDQVIDLGARVASQQASVVRVRTLLDQARSIGDIVSIESELSRREADLDSLTGRLAALKDQVALSTLTVDLTRVATPPVQASRSSGFLAGLGSGWDGLKALGSATGAVVGFLLPFLPVLALLAGIGWCGRRVLRNRRGAERPGI
ncbi:DUF4349 domain-containing protein [Pseudonocardia sp. 73-21]|uniref:DUF4349 domain-containing protein n=1 Tax=Pseudonocardia sp. 73-21 TaxID=1895809 RepID=UPI000968F948|nr:DUF4349 domain-containing protein [Pseudonocardia sp. 73-21]OJY37518.1 MAG: hypothetical protein BGP03_19045 [Pseudonocardia sp. 73-21]